MKQGRFCKLIMPLLLLVGTCTSVCSCSNDDDVNDVVVIDQDTVQDYDSISVDFRLMNSGGQAVKTFKEGEQILFNLTVTNKWDRTLKVKRPIYIVGEDLFQIYSNGKPVDRPWDFVLHETGPIAHYWSAHKSYVYECSLQGPAIDLDSLFDTYIEAPSSGVALFKTHDRQPLPVGNYYTEFKLILNEEHFITCHKDFSVLPK